MIKVTKARMKQLLQIEAKLLALEEGGVDNWDWYSVSLENMAEIQDDDIELKEEE